MCRKHTPADYIYTRAMWYRRYRVSREESKTSRRYRSIGRKMRPPRGSSFSSPERRRHLRKLDPSSQMGHVSTAQRKDREKRFLIGAFARRGETTVQRTVTIPSCKRYAAREKNTFARTCPLCAFSAMPTHVLMMFIFRRSHRLLNRAARDSRLRRDAACALIRCPRSVSY